MPGPRTPQVSRSECRNEALVRDRPFQIHCLDVQDLPPEAWGAILNESMFPFPIVTFKENGICAPSTRSRCDLRIDGARSGHNSCSESGRRSATLVLIDNEVVAGLFVAVTFFDEHVFMASHRNYGINMQYGSFIGRR